MFRLIVTNDEEVVQFAKEHGAGIFTAEQLSEDFVSGQGEEKKTEEDKVYFLLRMLAIPPNVKGYRYLKFVMEQCQKDPDYHTKSITKGIYPDCAKQFASTATRVERAIRHALELSFWKFPEKYSEVFGGTFKKAPTNSEFIGLVSEYFVNNK